jgi:hypothetical protein
MSFARIYQPDKTAMQSGKAKDGWVVEYIPSAPYFSDDLMGWNGMTDMLQELKLKFDTQEEAENYAKKQGIAYEIELPNPRHQVKKAYADNFAYRNSN